MIDHLAHRQTAGLNTSHTELNAKLDAIARQFGIDWLTADGDNPLQVLWKNRDALSTNELLNFGDALENFEKIDSGWLGEQVSIIKDVDEGNRAGAIFELLGLNMFVSASSKVVPAARSNPGYDGEVELPDKSSLLVSIKNHGITSYEKFFQKNAKQLDDQFQGWLEKHRQSGIELRILCQGRPDATAWADLKQDVKNILNGQLDGTAKNYKVKGKWSIVLKHIAPEYNPLSQRNISSIIFICARAHQNEQKKFIEDVRKGCSNLVKHTQNCPVSACTVLFVRLCASASIKNCVDWARDYFTQFPKERVGLIILYQAATVTSNGQTSLTHHVMPILGPQFASWAHPSSSPARHLPNMSILVGVIIGEASGKVIQVDGRQIPLDDAYSYQRGDIYRFYRLEGSGLQLHLSNPAPGIKIHAEIEKDGDSAVLQMVSSDRGELLLLP
jgi:hypothetical protein